MPFESPRIVPGQALYFVGDSNSLRFNYLCMELPEHFAQPIVSRCCYVPELAAATIAPGGALSDEIVAFFRREIVVGRSEGWKRFSAVDGSHVQATLLRSMMPPIQDELNFDNVLAVVLMVGTIDLGHLLRTIGTEHDFRVNDPHYVESAFSEPILPFVPVRPIVELIAATLAPLGDAIAALRAAGFESIYVHSLHPPTLDDVRYFRVRDTVSSAKIRYKTTVLVNAELERIAIARGVRFLDMWAATTVDGKIDPAVVYDGDHLNREGAKRSIDAILRDVVAGRGVPLGPRAFTYL